MVSFERPLGVSAKHLSELVSTTVSQKETTGSDTLTWLGVGVGLGGGVGLIKGKGWG